jgi:NAD(P)-dependent dehydrogenase (short-subunit alcohol dehydrogenase family)
MTDAADLLRPGVLSGRAVAVLHAGDGGIGAAVLSAAGDLGASLTDLAGHGADDEDGLTAAIAAAREAHGRLDAVVIDAAGLAAATAGDGLAPLRGAADAAWIATRAAGTAAMIDQPEGGVIVLVAPRPGADPHAHATRSALENFARTLSIEWARHQIRIVAVTPGRSTAASSVAALVAFLVSPGGDYYSGCRLSLGEADDAPAVP